MNKPDQRRRKSTKRGGPTHRTFSVRGQLRGKLGPAGFRELMESLEAVSKPRRSQRRKRVSS